MNAAKIVRVMDALSQRLSALSFRDPVHYVYNPLIYARKPFDAYCRKFGSGHKEVLLLGMNPGPWGMAQTGIPFGDVGMVKGWLDVDGAVSRPAVEHPKRPICGYQCSRGEISGQRLWGWARDRFQEPRNFFKRFWVGNYCPLIFLEDSGRNRTPDKLKKDEKKDLFKACDEALVALVKILRPQYVIGVGNFAHQRAVSALVGMRLSVARISHPSPANPKANAGWASLIESELSEAGLSL